MTQVRNTEYCTKKKKRNQRSHKMANVPVDRILKNDELHVRGKTFQFTEKDRENSYDPRKGRISLTRHKKPKPSRERMMLDHT